MDILELETKFKNFTIVDVRKKLVEANARIKFLTNLNNHLNQTLRIEISRREITINSLLLKIKEIEAKKKVVGSGTVFVNKNKIKGRRKSRSFALGCRSNKKRMTIKTFKTMREALCYKPFLERLIRQDGQLFGCTDPKIIRKALNMV